MIRSFSIKKWVRLSFSLIVIVMTKTSLLLKEVQTFSFSSTADRPIGLRFNSSSMAIGILLSRSCLMMMPMFIIGRMSNVQFVASTYNLPHAPPSSPWLMWQADDHQFVSDKNDNYPFDDLAENWLKMEGSPDWCPWTFTFTPLSLNEVTNQLK